MHLLLNAFHINLQALSRHNLRILGTKFRLHPTMRGEKWKGQKLH